MANIHRRCLRESQTGCRSVEVMLSVNDVWCFGQRAEIIDCRHAMQPKVCCGLSEQGAVNNNPVAAPLESCCDVERIELATRSYVEGIIRH